MKLRLQGLAWWCGAPQHQPTWQKVRHPVRWPGEVVVLLVGERTKTPQVGSAKRNRRPSAAEIGDLLGEHPVSIAARPIP